MSSAQLQDAPMERLEKRRPSPLNRISSIDSLRGIAALAVLFYHARAMLWVGLTETYRHFGFQPDFNAWLGYVSVPFSLGNLGVTLFFVLSGYCIHRRGATALASGNCANLAYKTFFARRFWRIYPTYVAALLLTALIDWWLTNTTGASHPTQNNSFFAFCVSLFTLQGYLAPHFGSNGVFWTLAMEVHLYAAYPLLFLFSNKFGANKTLLTTLCISLGYVVANAAFHIDDYLPYRFQRGPVFLPYWFTWAAGFYVAEIEAGRVSDFDQRLWKLLVTGGIAGGLALTLTRNHLLAEMLWALFFAGLLRWSLGPRGIRFWSKSFGVVLALIGVFSYSLYAVHAPLLQIYHAGISSDLNHKFATLWPAIGGAAFALVAGWAFFVIVEQWSIRRPSKVEKG
jgi:peptidoglycan/LPS O-acetylase OafA/YrhL